jgi:hypothetical protein
VTVVRAEEERAVVLYLPKELDLETLAAAWENEHHDVDTAKIGYDGDNRLVVVIQVTPKQLAEVQNKTIFLCRTKVRVLGPREL